MDKVYLVLEDTLDWHDDGNIDTTVEAAFATEELAQEYIDKYGGYIKEMEVSNG